MREELIKLMAEETIYSYNEIKKAYDFYLSHGGMFDMWRFFPLYMVIDMRDRGIISW